MQDPSTLKLQTPNLNQRPNSTCNTPPTRLLPTSSVPDSSKTHPRYLNSKPCFNLILSTQTSHYNLSSPFSTITLVLPALSFRPLTLHPSTKHPTIALRSSSDSPHKNKLSAYNRSGNLHSFPSSPSPSLSPSSLHPYIHLKSKGT